MAPSAVTPPTIPESKKMPIAGKHDDKPAPPTDNLGTTRKIICFSGRSFDTRLTGDPY